MAHPSVENVLLVDASSSILRVSQALLRHVVAALRLRMRRQHYGVRACGNHAAPRSQRMPKPNVHTAGSSSRLPSM